MSKTTYERGKTLTYPGIYPILTFTPIFGHRGDFIWIEKIMAAWPEHDSEFAFLRDTVHDERVDRLKDENAKLRELVRDTWRIASSTQCTACVNYDTCTGTPCDIKNRMQKLGIEVDR